MEEKIGVYVCECGPNIAEKVDIERVLAAVSSIEGVAVAERYKLLCSEEGKKFLKENIEKHGLTHLVVAACSPKQHELTFMNVCEEAGLNPYLFQLANIREQCAWIIEDKDEATEKAIRYVRAAISRVRYHIPLEKKEIEANPDVLVIGAGVAGIEASLLLASRARKVYLVERESSIGGKVKGFAQLFPRMESASALLEPKIKQVVENKNIELMTESEVEQLLGFFGNFVVTVRKKGGEERELNVGAVVVATGLQEFDVSGLPQYGYGKVDNVYTAGEFERMNSPDGPTQGKVLLKDGRAPRSVAIIHCVGRQEKGYCSRVCCLYSLKLAQYLKSKIPEVQVCQFYSDLCLPGKPYQRFYEETKGKGVDFIRAEKVEISEGEGGVAVNYSSESGRLEVRNFDMVILATAMEPAHGSAKLAEILNIGRGVEGFFIEEHEKLGPVSTSLEGIYIAGCAQGPKGISESIVQAEAAAGKILASLVPGRKLEPEVKVSEISEAFCIGCKTCISVCAYNAITFDELRRISVVNEVLCRGCGNCAAACPSGAARHRHFTFRQIYHELMETLR